MYSSEILRDQTGEWVIGIHIFWSYDIFNNICIVRILDCWCVANKLTKI